MDLASFLWILLGFGLIMTGLYVFAFFRSRHRSWTKVQATITSVHETVGHGGGKTIAIEYRYTDEQGNVHTGSCRNMNRKPHIGSPIAVVYDPDDQGRSEAARLGLIFTVAFYLVGLGVAATVWGLFPLPHFRSTGPTRNPRSDVSWTKSLVSWHSPTTLLAIHPQADKG